MPLPTQNVAWPPKDQQRIFDDYATWDAWYTGDPNALRSLYLGRTDTGPTNRPSTYRGGAVGFLARTFWGAPRADLSKPESPKLHVPVAADLCQASADLLFSEPPTITVDHAGTNNRLQELIGDGLLTTLAEAAEIGAALGGVFLRVTWDRAIRPDGPFLSKVDADGALPEFRWSQLLAVTFWTVVRRNDSGVVWRHLERHELNAAGEGVVLHGLYQGDEQNLGRIVPLADATATAGLADLINADGAILTDSPGLAVEYVPNQRPQRRWRKHPVGRNLGRSDLDGVEPLMDALDEAYTSWMRDLRLGKARVFVAQSLLQDLGPGQGAAWDSDAEVYAPINALPAREASGLPIEAKQFEIRYEAHQATCDGLFARICLTAGYSTQTFGEQGDTAMTATEVTARERRSFLTRDRKIRLWRPALGNIVTKLLAVDTAVFGSGNKADVEPDVLFADGVQESMLDLAQTAQALKTAGAASMKVLVQLVHPDWDDQAVDDEVALIQDETGMAVPDPFPGETAAGALGAVPAVGSTDAAQPDAG